MRPINNPKYSVVTALAKKMNNNETVSWLLVRMPWASDTIPMNDPHDKLGLETNTFTENLIAETTRDIL